LKAQARAEAWFASGMSSGGALCSLSVRSGLDSYLDSAGVACRQRSVDVALTIPDMWRVIEQQRARGGAGRRRRAHARAADGSLKRAASPKTKILLLAHIVRHAHPARAVRGSGEGARVALAQDCAQAFTGADYKGDPLADVSMFSFGPIKTAAALAGGVLCVRDPSIWPRCASASWRKPVQERGAFAQRTFKYAALKALTNPLMIGLRQGLRASRARTPRPRDPGLRAGFANWRTRILARIEGSRTHNTPPARAAAVLIGPKLNIETSANGSPL